MDQTRVGRTGWLVLHCVAEGAARLPPGSALSAVDRVVRGMGGVFPCRRCREDIVPTWKAVRAGRATGEDVRLTMVRFHQAVTQKVSALAGRPCKCDPPQVVLSRYGPRYERLVRHGVSAAYVASFLFSVVMNCRGIVPNIQLDHSVLSHSEAVRNFACRLLSFVRDVCSVLQLPPPKHVATDSCNQLHADWWKWVKDELLGDRIVHAVFGDFDTMRDTHLCTRVRSPKYDALRAPARFCGGKKCNGGCLRCDAALKRVWQAK